ncbi:ATP-dependent helicase [Chroococcidiopsis sp.]|uniref:ATP-dependent helicase n=1 Tax=Chroococcidiopsis sp. TaxID=3088168 RepID=UPI003F3F3C38
MPEANLTDQLSIPTPDSRLPTPANWEQLRNSLRPGQQQMADWQGGQLAVSAVPGAGKSTGMAAATAIAIARYQLHAKRAIVVVTFTRSAAANIKGKIRRYLREELSIPPRGFTVNTLHGLALNIASRYPDLSGLPLDNATLITPNQSHRLIRTCVEQWIAANSRLYSRLLEGRQFDGEETERLRRQSVLRTEVLPALAYLVIHEAKSSGYQPQQLRVLGEQATDEYEILTVAAGLYEQYQNLMRSRDLIDYDDMILAALRVLENPSARRNEQKQVFAVFEDEAQDSSPLQTKLLEILAQDPENPDLPANLIRVGDPNQAINSTFTPADPIYFRRFCEECQQQQRLATMDMAGRSTRIVIATANFMLEWVNGREQGAGSREQGAGSREQGRRGQGGQGRQGSNSSHQPLTTSHAPLPFREQTIHPVSLDDPQPDANPAPIGGGLELHTPRDIHHTAELIGRRVVALYQAGSNGETPTTETPNSLRMAVLVRENRQGRWLAEAIAPICQEHNIVVYEVSESDRHSQVPVEVLALLQFLDRPHSPDYLKAALEVLVQRQLIQPQDLNALATIPEQFLYPGPLDAPQPEPAQKASHLCRSLLRARMELPPYQLISFLALTLNYDQAELATADKLAERVQQQLAGNGNNNLAAMLIVLSEIVNSERFEAVDAEDSEARYTRPGQLTIITMHKAKGLDWDCVFIPFLHENTIPGNLRVLPQSHFLGDFTVAEVARAQIRAALHEQFPLPDVATAWEQAKQLKTAEEFRLLYVAITRAKRLLWISAAQKAPFTWSKPENLDNSRPCPVFSALVRQFPRSVVTT